MNAHSKQNLEEKSENEWGIDKTKKSILGLRLKRIRHGVSQLWQWCSDLANTRYNVRNWIKSLYNQTVVWHVKILRTNHLGTEGVVYTFERWYCIAKQQQPVWWGNKVHINIQVFRIGGMCQHCLESNVRSIGCILSFILPKC